MDTKKPSEQQEHGEGNYKAAREYQEAVKKTAAVVRDRPRGPAIPSEQPTASEPPVLAGDRLRVDPLLLHR